MSFVKEKIPNKERVSPESSCSMFIQISHSYKFDDKITFFVTDHLQFFEGFGTFVVHKCYLLLCALLVYES
jgi:hypothetical protein